MFVLLQTSALIQTHPEEILLAATADREVQMLVRQSVRMYVCMYFMYCMYVILATAVIKL